MIIFMISSLSANTDTALRRSNGLLRFIAEQESLRNMTLSSVIGTRCSRYMPSSEKTSCKDAVKKMIHIMDYDIIFPEQKVPPKPQGPWTPSSFLFVAFKQDLMNLLSEPKTKVYLKNLNEDLYRYLTAEKESLNIWELTKTHYQSDYSASKVIAVLFQDTSLMKLHIGYLEHVKPTGTEIYEGNIELLSRVIDTINLVLDNSEEHYRKLFYPPTLQKDLNKNIYHFYVPLFLAKALEREAISKDSAYAATLMLTLSYEFITTARSYEFILKDPETIKNAHTVQDIFGGYCGSMIGAYGPRKNKSFSEIQDKFFSSTLEGVELLLKH